MRKLLFVLAVVFAVAFGFGTMAPDTAEAGDCFFACSCSGQPLICCANDSGGVSCKPTTLWNCPQVHNC